MRLGGRKSTLNPQPWPWAGPRVLIEQPDESRASSLVAGLRSAGFAVAICPGPLAGERCPLASEQDCVAAYGADAVISGLGLKSAAAREALAALRARLPRMPLVVEAEPAEVARWPELLQGCEVVPAPAEPHQLVERLRAILPREVGGHA